MTALVTFSLNEFENVTLGTIDTAVATFISNINCNPEL
jgi:hypothetical protein